jgi:hypothetical protein
LTGFYLLPQTITSALGAAEGFFLGEMAVTHYPDLDRSGAIPYLLNNYTMPDKTSWGYVAEFGLTYANIFQSGWTMSPVLDFYHDVEGTSPTALPFVEGRKAVALNLNFDYHNEWKAGIGYVTYLGRRQHEHAARPRCADDVGLPHLLTLPPAGRKAGVSAAFPAFFCPMPLTI